MKLSVRLAFVFGIFGLLIVAGIATSAWWLAAREIREATDDSLRARSSILDNLTTIDAGVLAEFGRSPVIPPDVFGIEGSGGQIFDAAGDHLAGEVIGLPVAITDELRAGEPVLTTESVDDRTYRVYTVRFPDELTGPLSDAGAYGVQLYTDVTTEEEAIAALALWLTGLGAGGVALVGGSSWIVGRRLAAPIRDLTDAAEGLTEPGAPSARIEVTRNDEVGQLADTFNRMAAALEIGREQQQRLVADASHELRTPLTSLRMRADFLVSLNDLPDEHRAIIEGAVVDVERLTALVSDLIDLATDAGTPDEEAGAEPARQRREVRTARWPRPDQGRSAPDHRHRRWFRDPSRGSRSRVRSVLPFAESPLPPWQWHWPRDREAGGRRARWIGMGRERPNRRRPRRFLGRSRLLSRSSGLAHGQLSPMADDPSVSRERTPPPDP